MLVLIVPDVHLKPWMFQRASALMKVNKINQAICLMDLVDDWQQQYNIDLYVQTYDAAAGFAREYPSTLWCFGNHDVSYLWQQRETGYSPIAPRSVCSGIEKLRQVLPDPAQLAFVHRIDKVLFMHGGLTEEFIRCYVYGNLAPDYTECQTNPIEAGCADVDNIIQKINGFGYSEMWNDGSPIWFRPQVWSGNLFGKDSYLQVVGHTPVEKITRTGNVLSCDTFSLNSQRRPIGSQEFTLLNTETWQWRGIE